jgi:hypothetical protein
VLLSEALRASEKSTSPLAPPELLIGLGSKKFLLMEIGRIHLFQIAGMLIVNYTVANLKRISVEIVVLHSLPWVTVVARSRRGK